jgi:D-3-phosphoglycerate dehydrogenase / 2-oxoglutarate reductase
MANSAIPLSSCPSLLIPSDCSKDQIDWLRQVGEIRLDGWDTTGEIATIDETIAMMQRVDILIVGYELITEGVIAQSKLRLITSIRSGPGANIDLESAGRHGIPVTGTIGRETRPVADFTFGIMLALLRHIAIASRMLSEGKLTTDNTPYEDDIGWGMRPEDP